jgi:acetylornithine aminotransferase
MTSSSDWIARYQGSVMNTFGMPQRVLVRGEGARVWDVDGNEYLDLLGGIAVNSLGHAHPAIIDAVTSQLNRLGHVSNLFASEPQIQLAEKLISLLGHDGRVFFTNSGAEANEAAFKATRITGRTTIVAAEGSFHGRTMGALALTAKQQYREPFEPLPGDVRWVPYGDVDALAAAVDESVAAVILEPIQGEAGVIVPPDGYLEQARAITAAKGALLWLDEVQTGIGRTGGWFDHASTGVVPDLITLAKGLGGGIPIGALIAVGEAATLLGPGNHGTTFGGNPVATAAALAVINTIEQDNLLEHVSAVGDLLADRLSTHALVDRVTGQGLLLGVVLREPVALQIHRLALDAGLIVNAPTPDRLRLAPPLILTSDQAGLAASALTAIFDEVTQP